MNRIIKTAAIAAIAAIGVIGTAGAASASVNVTDGVGHVDKSDVQTALGWNNGDFDKNVSTLKFTAAAEKVVVDYAMICMDLNTGAFISGGHQLIIQPGTATIEAQQVLNAGNGKQITGFDLTPASGGFVNVGSRVLRNVCPDGAVPVMNDTSILPAQPNTVSVVGGLKVSGMTKDGLKTVDLPNTPPVIVTPTV